jgi:hypothetical protein
MWGYRELAKVFFFFSKKKYFLPDFDLNNAPAIYLSSRVHPPQSHSATHQHVTPFHVRLARESRIVCMGSPVFGIKKVVLF